MSVPSTDNFTRLRMLQTDLRAVRRAVERVGAADSVHTFHNGVLTAQGALSLVEARLNQGRTDHVAGLLELAEQRLRCCRALMARRASGVIGARARSSVA